MRILVVGSGIAGLSAAIQAAERGAKVTMISPYISERAQSVMAAGGINAAADDEAEKDSPEFHADDTYKGGCYIENYSALLDFCRMAPDNLRWIAAMGVVFNRDDKGNICRRAFGGQSRKRTAYAGASTGKQIVTALNGRCREYEINGQIERITGYYFHSALIKDGKCYGILAMRPSAAPLTPFYADSVIMATGGQNRIFGKTTGTLNADGYAAAKLFSQGVRLRNLEFIQYHPTTIETAQKRMLITEAARGEGGRLYYLEDGKRRYFMEEKYGEKGNLMPRDIVSKCIYDCPSQVFLDITFLGGKLIHERLQEVYDLCRDYINLDVTKESIPVVPSVHFFMGGIDVDSAHESTVARLFAAGECASRYHGANRLGGNSLMAAVHSGRVAADACVEKYASEADDGAAGRGNIFDDWISHSQKEIDRIAASKSEYPVEYVAADIADIMNRCLGITRTAARLEDGIRDMDYYLKVIKNIRFDPLMNIYDVYRLEYQMLLSKAILMSALARKETRGAHIREDYPASDDDYRKCSLAEYRNGEICISFRDENVRNGQ